MFGVIFSLNTLTRDSKWVTSILQIKSVLLVAQYKVHTYNSFFILDNPFQCDCRIAWLRDWINNKGSAVISMPQETKCVSPEEYKDILLSEIPTDQLICLNSATKNTHNLGVSVWKSIFSVLLLICVL